MSIVRTAQDLDLTLVIPVYNEDENVVALHAEITTVLATIDRIR